MPEYEQTSFLGGLNRQFDPTKIADDEYPLLINGRTRDDEITPILLPQQITQGLPEITNFQGLYSAGLYLIAFADGKAYYKSFDPSAPSDKFTEIEGLELDPNVERVYFQLVPGSSINFKRQLKIAGKASSGVDFTTISGGSPDCGVVMDGVNQDFIIYPDASFRVTQNWSQWTETETGEFREYVPIGILPMFHDGILYKAGKDKVDGRLNRILRSVTGRPLDFMLIVDDKGQKALTENEGNADVLAHRVEYNTITSINEINAIEGSFFVGTSYNGWLVTPSTDPATFIYGEPKFSNRWLFGTGPLNQFCVTDATGDTLFIDSKGIVSFNAVLAAKYEGRNLPFSRRIHPLFKGITQTTACCTRLDNLIYFGVNTVYGPAVVVYDELLGKWVSVDLYPGVNLIKQFAVISTTLTKKLFFITSENKLYEAYASPTVATTRVYLGDWLDKQHQKVINVDTSFKDIYVAGSIRASLFTDGKKISTLVQEVDVTKTTSTLPLEIPFGRTDEDNVLDLKFNFDAPIGKKHGVLLEWNCNATLSGVDLQGATHNPQVDHQQEALIQSSLTELVGYDKFAFVGWAGMAGTTLSGLINQMKDEECKKYVLVGNVNQPYGQGATLQDNVKQYWDYLKGKSKVYACLGNRDLDTANGQAFLQYFRQGGRYFKQELSSLLDVFVLNSGINSASVLVEPDGNTSDSKQAKWLKFELGKSFKKWKVVVVFENPLYNSTLDWPYHLWGASLVICAKNRNYERLYTEQNYTYINCGSGSTVGFDGFVYPYLASSKVRDNITNGYVTLEPSEMSLDGKFIAYPSKRVVDTFQILG